MQMVFDAQSFDHREKVILLAYCNFTDAHGYVWAGVTRIAHYTGASEPTVKRVRSQLQKRGLLATKRRINPKTGQATSSITRINLAKLAEMKRPEQEYDDNVVETLLFEDETPGHTQIDQSDPGDDLRIDQSDPTPGINLIRAEGQIRLIPDPSDDPSASSSRGRACEGDSDGSGAEQPRRRKKSTDTTSGAGGSESPEEMIRDIGVTDDELGQLVEQCRGEATKSLSGYVRRLVATGDMAERLRRLRQPAQPASVSVPAPRQSGQSECELHSGPVPCTACRTDYLTGIDRTAIAAELDRAGAEARPDLADLIASR